MAQTRFTPREIDEILPNPNMGWETFHFTADRDRNLPAWLPSTVHYLRWGWDDVEPRVGEIDSGMIDRTLNAAVAAGQTTAFRVMCCSSDPRNPYHPAWLKEIPGGVIQVEYGETRLEVPDLGNERVLEAHLSLIRRLGEKYDGDPRISHLDLGSVGWWGEWHMSGSKSGKMPSAQTCRRIVDAYFAAFRKTPLVMLIGGETHTAYACAKGAGWRADCLGDLGGFSKNWCHMRKGYPQWFREANLSETWKRAPVAYESCWDMRRWKQEKWPLRYIFNYALATHASYINNKSAPLPDGEDVRPEIERFLKRLGYRIVVRDVTVAASPGRLAIQSTWQNIGSAPCYTPFPIAWRLTRPDGSFVQATPTNDSISQLMPGSVDLFTPEFIANPPDLPPGRSTNWRIWLPATTSFRPALGRSGPRSRPAGLLSALPSRAAMPMAGMSSVRSPCRAGRIDAVGQEQFLSEPITPDSGTFDVRAMARGEPGLPAGFVWRGKHYDVADVIETWKSNAVEGEGSMYLRRHWFRVRTGSGEVFTLYCLRQAPSGKRRQRRWWIYSAEGKASDSPCAS